MGRARRYIIRNRVSAEFPAPAPRFCTEAGDPLPNTIHDDAALLARNAELERRVLDRTAQLEATERELQAFGATLSHDLRAPLRSIEGFSRLLLQQCSQQLDATGQDYLQRVHRASLRLAQMMDDLLQLVRLARDGVRSERVDLSRMAEDILAALRAADAQRSVETTLEPGIVVTGDARLLRLCLESLLGNAWKFTSRTADAQIFFGRDSDAGVPALCVRDNGAGFEQKYSDKLFRAFQRLHGESEFEGSGMGLARAQRVVLAHGGRIWARSQRGAGAAFYFTLPDRAATGATGTNLEQ